jgi:uncharacterized Zn finger protein
MPFWGRYIPVAERRAKAKQQINKLRKKGKDIQPVEIDGRKIARSFWGKGWCDHLESFSDYENRLPRGRTYVRNGSVCHLEIHSGHVEAMVAGSSLYKISIAITKLKPAAWKSIKEKCVGQVGSMLELLQGKLSDQVMAVVSDQKEGLFPKPDEIQLSCNCPDWAVMCKHVASALYGVGSRLDTQPELLFLLRGVDAQELIATELALPDTPVDAAADTLDDEQLSGIFGIDLDTETPEEAQPVPTKPSKRPKRRARGGTAAKVPKKKKAPSAKAKKKTAPRNTAKPFKKATRPKKSIPVAGVSDDARAKDSPKTRPRIRPTGKSVTRLRKQLGLSVAQFAQKLGVTPASVYRWESTQGPLQLQTRPMNALAELHQQAKTK